VSWVGLTSEISIDESAWPELGPKNRGMDSKWDLYLYLGIYLIAIFLGHYDSKKSSQNFFGKIFFHRKVLDTESLQCYNCFVGL